MLVLPHNNTNSLETSGKHHLPSGLPNPPQKLRLTALLPSPQYLLSSTSENMVSDTSEFVRVVMGY